MGNKKIEKEDGIERVLLTFVGNTDPTRGNYDGPILHICRYYKPEKIYLILTEEMKKRNENRIYEKSINENLKNYNPKVEYINTNIKDAHLFDIYFDVINNTFKRIKEEHPKSEVLVNLTSGTSQMTANLISYIIDSTNINILPIQVSTPAEKGNDTKVVNDLYKVTDEGENNYDNIEEFKTNRIIFPDLRRYSRILVKNQIQELLKQYKYTTCIELLKRNVFNQNNELNILLNFADDRKHLKGLENYKKENDINKNLNNKKYNDIYYYKKDKKKFKVEKWYQIVDYFALARIEGESGNIGRYILMLEPLIVNIYFSILENILKINLDNLFDKDKDKKYLLKTSKLKRELVEYIEKNAKLKGKLKDGKISDRVLVSIIKYYLEKENNDKMELSYIENFSKIFLKVKNVRNDVAHELIQIDTNEFEKKAKISISETNEKILEFFKKYYSNFGYKESMIYVYDEINKLINELLEQER